MEDKGRYLTLTAAARSAGFSRAFLRQAIDRGELRAYRPGKGYLRLRLADIDAWVTRFRVPPRAKARQP